MLSHTVHVSTSAITHNERFRDDVRPVFTVTSNRGKVSRGNAIRLLDAEGRCVGIFRYAPGDQPSPAGARCWLETSATIEIDGARVWQVWSEGYMATGDHATATYHGSALALTFEEACDKLLKGNANYDREKRTHWGCRMFDNEADARKAYG